MRRFRVACASRDTSMSEVMRTLIEAWLSAISEDPAIPAKASEVATTAIAATPKAKEVSDISDLIEEFIRFATEPSVEDRNWSKHTLALLRERIADRKAKSADAGAQSE